MSTRPPSTSAAPAQDAIRLHVQGPLHDGAHLTLAAPQAHYLAHVMRRGPGDRLRVFNGTDGEHLAIIAEARRERCVVTLGPQVRPQPQEPDLWLVFALLKRHPTDLIAQKATELGAAALLPVFTTHTNADRTNLARLQAIATEAAEQSERLTVPIVHPPRALSAVLAAWPAQRRLIACCERGDHPPVPRHQSGPQALLIGPEGGFTEAELDAVRACPFVATATLGPRVLRAETAVIVGLALMQAS